MDHQIAEKLRILRAAWKPTEDRYVAGMIPDESASLDVAAYPYLCDLYAVTDGPACGVVVFHKSDELDRSQALCEYIEGGGDGWFCAGCAAEDMLLIRRTDGMVARVERDALAIIEIAPFEEFMNEWILGENYRDLAMREDEWFKFTKRAGIR